MEGFSSECLKAIKKFKELGPLGVTDSDHLAIGSTPPDLLKNNPGKTKIDLMSDQEILAQLKEWDENVKKYSQEEFKDNTFVQSYLPKLKEDFKVSIKHLRELNRLPNDFENFDIN